MKTRIIGTLLLIIVLGGLFVATNQSGGVSNHVAPVETPQPSTNDSALKSLSIN